MKAPDLNVVSVIDPKNNNNEVEIHPQEILQIVFINCPNVNWTIEEQYSSIRLKALRNETFINDGFERKLKGNFQVYPYTKNIGDIQQHFWFRINPADEKKVNEAELGYQRLVNLVFYNGEGSVVSRVKVYLSIEPSDKDDFLNLMQETIWSGKDLIQIEANSSGLEHRIDRKNGYVFDPGFNEYIEIECKLHKMLFELPQPSHSKDNSKWEAKTRIDKRDGATAFDLKEILPRTINGRKIQRFLLTNYTRHMYPYVKLMSLGEIVFKTNDSDTRFHKKISLAVSEPIIDTHFAGSEYDELDEFNDIDAAYYFSSHVDYSGTSSIRKYKPRKSKIEIREIDNSLTNGVKLFKTFLPKSNWPENPKLLLPVSYSSSSKLETFVKVDPRDNEWIEINEDQELIIMMYRDPTPKPPNWLPGEWEVVYPKKMLNVLFIQKDPHHQRFSFKINKSSIATVETLLFKMRGRERTVHVVNKKQITNESNNDLVLESLLNSPVFNWRTVTAISEETKLSHMEVLEILDLLEKSGKVKKHTRQAGLWAHEGRATEDNILL